MLAALTAAADDTIWSSFVNVTFGCLTLCFSLICWPASVKVNFVLVLHIVAWSNVIMSSDHNNGQSGNTGLMRMGCAGHWKTRHPESHRAQGEASDSHQDVQNRMAEALQVAED